MLFDKIEDNNENSYLIKVAALLIHAAKIDEKYSIEEELIIKKTLFYKLPSNILVKLILN